MAFRRLGSQWQTEKGAERKPTLSPTPATLKPSSLNHKPSPCNLKVSGAIFENLRLTKVATSARHTKERSLEVYEFPEFFQGFGVSQLGESAV